MKIVVKFIILIATFIGGWFLLSQIDWVEKWGVKRVSEDSEEKISEFIKENIERTEEIVKDREVIETIDSLLKRITKRNNLRREDIKLVILNKSEVNAFALPTDYLVINSGLIKACESPEALTGIMAHELGHIQLNHVRRKLIKELGLAVLVSSTSGGGGEVIKQITHTLSSSAYDRSLEMEADEQAFDYLLKANVNPEPLAEFFYSLAMDQPDIVSDLQWLNTHPDSKERAEIIVQRLSSENKANEFEQIIDPSSWSKLQEIIAEKY